MINVVYFDESSLLTTDVRQSAQKEALDAQIGRIEGRIQAIHRVLESSPIDSSDLSVAESKVEAESESVDSTSPLSESQTQLQKEGNDLNEPSNDGEVRDRDYIISIYYERWKSVMTIVGVTCHRVVPNVGRDLIASNEQPLTVRPLFIALLVTSSCSPGKVKRQ